MKLRSWVVAVSAAVLSAAALQAQTVTLDEGTFRVLVGGREVGLETFSIRQSGTGADAFVIVQGKVVLEAGSEYSADLQLASGLRPIAYDVEVRGGDARRINARVSGSRASARTVSAAGETMREYLVSEGALLLDDGVAHHYFFLAQRLPAGGTTAIVIPRESRQVQATVTVAGEESISAGGQTVRARKLVVTLAGGDVRHVWVDAQNRVLRVEVPAKNYTAVRTTLP
ncbi:MAG TPA: hypothetical protein VMN60_01185 [Longimicrobiales bacterium]|nr:hypothetical protein [Longimicrobiales bacterium]